MQLNISKAWFRMFLLFESETIIGWNQVTSTAIDAIFSPPKMIDWFTQTAIIISFLKKICSSPSISSFVLLRVYVRVAEVAREHGWHPPKSLDSDENFKPKHTLFCRELRFVAIYALFFGDLWAKKVPFWVKQCFLGKKCTITWYILHILLS